MSKQPTMVISVGCRDIEKGIPGDLSRCAISCAVARLKHCAYGKISTDGAIIRVGGVTYRPKTLRDERKLSRFVSNFDSDSHRRYCRPTTIVLEKDI